VLGCFLSLRVVGRFRGVCFFLVWLLVCVIGGVGWGGVCFLWCRFFWFFFFCCVCFFWLFFVCVLGGLGWFFIFVFLGLLFIGGVFLGGGCVFFWWGFFLGGTKQKIELKESAHSVVERTKSIKKNRDGAEELTRAKNEGMGRKAGLKFRRHWYEKI